MYDIFFIYALVAVFFKFSNTNDRRQSSKTIFKAENNRSTSHDIIGAYLIGVSTSGLSALMNSSASAIPFGFLQYVGDLRSILDSFELI